MTHITSKIRDVATKPTKIEQTNESTIKFLTKNKFNCILTDKNKVRPGLELLTLGCKGDGVTSRPIGNKPKSSKASITKQERKARLVCKKCCLRKKV